MQNFKIGKGETHKHQMKLFDVQQNSKREVSKLLCASLGKESSLQTSVDDPVLSIFVVKSVVVFLVFGFCNYLRLTGTV